MYDLEPAKSFRSYGNDTGLPVHWQNRLTYSTGSVPASLVVPSVQAIESVAIHFVGRGLPGGDGLLFGGCRLAFQGFDCAEL
jgi:hypothetical protein